MTIKNKFDLEDEVYLKTDPEQLMRMVTGIYVKPGNVIVYELSHIGSTSDHYDFEITKEVNELTKVK